MHIFIIALFAAAIFAIVESDKKQQPPKINDITLSYKNDTAYFGCRSYYGKKNRKLAITYNNGNSDEKKEIDSTYTNTVNELKVPLVNGTGIYECLTESKEGFTSVTVKLTNALNIFLGENRDFIFYFRAYPDYEFNSRTYTSFLYANYKENRSATVPCFKDGQALERMNLKWKGQRYMDVSPVSGVYKCIDKATKEVYGFEIRITSKSFDRNEGSANISPAHCIRAQGHGFQDKSRHVEIDQIFLVLENDTAYLGCRSYLGGNQRRTLAITYDKGNGDEKKGIASKRGKRLIEPLKTKINDFGIYECSVKDVVTGTSATVKFTNELNIFPGKNRQLKFEFRAGCDLNDKFRAKNFGTVCTGVLHAKNNENQNVAVSCLKDDQPLEMRKYTDISPVSGVYKCTDNATREVYGFEIQIANECE